MTTRANRRLPARTLGQFDPRRNSLNALRLILAVLVIVSHAWPLGGFGPDPQWGDFTIGTWAVAGFFAISGWLITGSRLESALGSFLWRRVLRIYPAFLVCLSIVGLVFAPLAAALGGGTYGVLDGARYVGANSLLVMFQARVGDTPTGLPYEESWNGSLWTLTYEVFCYVLVGLVVSFVVRRWLRAVMVGGLVGFVAAELAIGAGVPAPEALHLLTMLAPFFFAGGVLFLFRDHIPATVPLAALSLAGCVAVALTGVNGVLAAVPLTYLLLWFGERAPLQSVGARNDISYGVYIYAFPVQQGLALLGLQQAGVALFALGAVVATVPLAAASWFVVERPVRRWRRLFDESPAGDSAASRPVAEGTATERVTRPDARRR